jgi:DNA-binding response OmpR family regulator
MEKKLMVVDDDPYILIAIREIFKPENLEVLTVSKGEDCIQELKKGFKNGVILMDIMMPGMDGWSTVEKIVNKGYLDGNIITILTAKDIPDKKMEDLRVYITDYITKPFDPDKLVAIVKDYFTRIEKN